jgi:hypothetical protein
MSTYVCGGLSPRLSSYVCKSLFKWRRRTRSFHREDARERRIHKIEDGTDTRNGTSRVGYVFKHRMTVWTKPIIRLIHAVIMIINM